jgi:hypothetical protein
MTELQQDLRDALTPVLERYGAAGHVELAVQVLLDRIPVPGVHTSFVAEIQTLFNAEPVPT